MSQIRKQTISYNPTTSHSNPKPNFKEDVFRSLGFNKANFEDLITKLDHFDWLSLRNSCSFEDFPEVFTSTLLEICKSCTPRKRVRTGRPQAVNAQKEEATVS